MKMVHVLAALVVVLSLVGCGGGGGGDSSTPVTTAAATPVATPPTSKVKCSDGTDAATVADCPLTVVTSSSVADGASVSPDTFEGVSFALSGALDPATLTEENIALWAGTAGVPGNAVRVKIVPSDKGFLIAPVAKLGYGQVYVVTVVKDSILDTLGRPVQVNGFSFTATAMVCTGLTVWSDDYGTCVVPLGVQLVGVNQMQDTTCTADQWTWTSSCFSDAIQNGTVQVAQSTALADGKPLIAALFADTAGANVILAFDVTDPKNPVRIGGNLLSDFAGALVFNWAIPNPTFLLANLTISSVVGNYQFSWDTATKTFVYKKL